MQGNEGTFTFLETVLKEVLELFPSQHIHIGGDEVGHPAPSFTCRTSLLQFAGAVQLTLSLVLLS